MKASLKTPLLAFVLITLVLASCSDSDNKTTPKITAPVGKIVAKVGGVSFEAVGAAQLYNNQIILGGDTQDETMSIIITKSARTGTYDFKGAALGVTPDAELNYSSGLSLYSSVFAVDGQKVGSVTITEIDETNKTISGVFSGSVSATGSTKEVAEGSFNKLPYITTAESTMTAKIDNTAFTATTAVAEVAQGVIVLNGSTLNGSKIITISFSDDITPGTYTVGEIGDDIYATYTVNLDTYVSTTGVLNITKHDKSLKRIEGTFSFTAEPFLTGTTNHAITGGAFAITYF